MSPDNILVAHQESLNLLKTVEQYIQDPENHANAIPGSMCVDGRYGREQTPGMIGRTGADLGDASTLLALNEEKGWNLSVEQILDLAVKAAVALHGFFYFHTDKHATHKENSLGCGHQAQQTNSENQTSYQVPAKKVQELNTLALKKAKTNPLLVNIVLELENHEEVALIINHGKTKTLRHSGKNSQQFFIYDKERDLEYMQELVAKINELGKGLLPDKINPEDFIRFHNQQRDATVALLITSKGIPVFETNLDEETPKAIPIGTFSSF